MFRLPCAAQNRNPRRRSAVAGGARSSSPAARRAPAIGRERRSDRVPGTPSDRVRLAPQRRACRRGTAVVVKVEVENFRLAPRHFGGEPQLGEGSIRFSLNRVPDCVDPEKLQNAIRKPDRQGPPGRRLLRLPPVRRPQRRARRADRLHRQLLAGDPAGDLLQRPAARLLPADRRPRRRTTARRPPSTTSPTSRSCRGPATRSPTCAGGKVPSAKAAAAAAID